jgi:hypothetical protein
VSASASVPAAAFMKLMLDKCADAKRMWGCAFAYDAGAPGATGEGCCMYVRLREDRRSVDVVAVMEEGLGSRGLAQKEVDSITRALGKQFNGAGDRLHLCPVCCSADMFVRSGAVHAFHAQEVAVGSTLHCSRYHHVTPSDVTLGKLTRLDMGSLPLVYPSRFHELQLPWTRVAAGGIVNSNSDAQSLPQSPDCGASRLAHDRLTCQPADTFHDQPALAFHGRSLHPPPFASVSMRSQHLTHPALDGSNSAHRSGVDASSRADSDPCLGIRSFADVQAVLQESPFLERAELETDATAAAGAAFSSSAQVVADTSLLDGTFTDLSFFVLTGQVAAGDVISAEHLREFMRQLGMCSSQDCACDVTLISGQQKTLHFSYTVGQCIPNSYCDTPIACILPADIGDRAQHPQAPRLPRFCAHDNVLVIFGPIQKGTKFLVFPGSSVNLQLCRLTPALCQNDLTAACCWSELQVPPMLLLHRRRFKCLCSCLKRRRTSFLL